MTEDVGIPLKYWELTTLFSIAFGIETCLSIDVLTIKINWGHFTHVYINLNMLDTLHGCILVE